MKILTTLLLTLFLVFKLFCQNSENQPINIANKLAEILIDSIKYDFKTSILRPKSDFNQIKQIDFSQTFGNGKPGVAYAYSILSVSEKSDFQVLINHSNGLKMWLNDSLIYEKTGDRKVIVNQSVINFDSTNRITLNLRIGSNTILIKSETKGDQWIFGLKPILNDNFGADFIPQLGIISIPCVSKEVAELTEWLIIGPFPNPSQGSHRSGISAGYGPEQGFNITHLYIYDNQTITWTIPNVEIFTDLVEQKNKPGLNTHTAQFVWSIIRLNEKINSPKFTGFINQYLDFQLDNYNFFDYQLNKNRINNDFASSPDIKFAYLMPFTYKLLHNNNLDIREDYFSFIKKITNLPLSHNEVKNSNNKIFINKGQDINNQEIVFMALPFLIYYSSLVGDEKLKQQIYNEVTEYILMNHSVTWDEKYNLYNCPFLSGDFTEIVHSYEINGLILWTLTEILKEMPRNNKNYKKLQKRYLTIIEAITKFQDKNSGFWPYSIENKDIRDDIISTSLITLSIARGINQGWLDKKMYNNFAIKGWKSIENLDKNVIIEEFSTFTHKNEFYKTLINSNFYFNNVPGIECYFVAALEMQKLLHEKK